MLHIESKDGETEISQRSRFFPIVSGFFLTLALATLIVGAATGHLLEALARAFVIALVGVVFGLMPGAVCVKADRATGELTRTARSLLGRRERVEQLSDLSAVAVVTSTYYWDICARTQHGGLICLFSKMKTTWTWVMTPSRAILEEAKQLADALSLPLETSAAK